MEYSKKIDIISFQAGMINCFVEMVACGVKRLALSPPVDPANYEIIGKISDEVVKGFGIKSYLEKSLLITDIQSAEFTRGKWSILYFADQDVLKEYLELKEKKSDLAAKGELDSEAMREITKAFGRLLSYPEEIIEEKINQENPPEPFSLV